MDRADALAFVSRMFDAADAGAAVWCDLELVRRFLAACSRTCSSETRSGYQREIRHLIEWRDQHHAGVPLRLLDPAIAQDFVDGLLQQVETGAIKPRTFNRRIAAISAMYRWASEPCRSGVSGVPRNPMPRRSMLQAAKCTRALTEPDLDSVLGVIAAAARNGCRLAQRDYVLVRGAYLIGCRVSELARLRWCDVEAIEDGGQVHLLGKGSKARTVRISTSTLELLESLGGGAADAWLFPSSRTGEHLTRQAIGDRMRRWGNLAGVHLHPHKLRHSHATVAIRRGADIFVLQATLGHTSSATTGAYVAANPADSSSLRLG
ncbi:tyrosine-type recombinase/integrase [Cyanobium sp. WAJ14-Wanaka]|uniref:tyrosine-type recombinase/integrase n=1 Tax=Cyanobium sp. WAJ14-Wanaka TaxID=2823725 RepID=UPI0020CC8493|nr:tyrosine-type recombinase/integrase [Cyanobium sp. WAJ14-Wanaka]MCP9776202.1 tyrosine-type recombinase/integrase [Cyanobium sp. WAJ14-Wanaka]